MCGLGATNTCHTRSQTAALNSAAMILNSTAVTSPCNRRLEPGTVGVHQSPFPHASGAPGTTGTHRACDGAADTAPTPAAFETTHHTVGHADCTCVAIQCHTGAGAPHRRTRHNLLHKLGHSTRWHHKTSSLPTSESAASCPERHRDVQQRAPQEHAGIPVGPRDRIWS